MDKYLEFAKEVSYKAMGIMKENFLNNISTYKDDNTIVTDVDIKINEYLISEVKKRFPNTCVLGEEKSFGDSNYAWVVDPIDGTSMYSCGVLTFCFSLALVHDGEVILSCVADPNSSSLYTAVKGRGAYKNDKRIYVNSYTLTDKRSVSHFDMFPLSQYDLYDVIRELNKKSYFVSIGSIVRAGTLVAEGKFTCALFPGTISKFCDIAAIKLLVEEAGGVVLSLKGKEQNYTRDIDGAIICNKESYDEVLDICRRYVHEI